jgi:hypothetical protein
MSLKAHGRKARKILVGSVGIATASFIGVGCRGTSVANLPAPPSCEVQPLNPYCIGPKPDAGTDAPADVAADKGGMSDAHDAGGDVASSDGGDDASDAGDGGAG